MSEANLYRVSEVTWVVVSPNSEEPMVYQTIETAADYLESIGVRDDEIDIALAEMYARKHSHAHFGMHGNFIFSDEKRVDGLLGVA